MTDRKSRTVLISGASKGIGRATALRLDAAGWTVLAGYRDESDAETLARRASDRLVPLRLDVTDGTEIQAARELADELAPGGLDGLVNNAGIVVAGPVEALDLDQVRHQFEVNVFGVVALTRALLPSLRRRRGRIVNVSSLNGRLATRFSGIYAASKHAVEALSDALRTELRHWEIPVVVIQPGAVATPIWDTSLERARRNLERLSDRHRELYGSVLERMAERIEGPPKHAIPPERVAAKIERALTARWPRARYLVGWDARLGVLLQALLPTWLSDRLLR